MTINYVPSLLTLQKGTSTTTTTITQLTVEKHPPTLIVTRAPHIIHREPGHQSPVTRHQELKHLTCNKMLQTSRLFFPQVPTLQGVEGIPTSCLTFLCPLQSCVGIFYGVVVEVDIAMDPGAKQANSKTSKCNAKTCQNPRI